MRWIQWWVAKQLARHYAIHTPSMTSMVCQTFGYPPLVAPLGCRIPSISREGEDWTPNLFLMLPPWLQVNAASAVGALNWSPDLTLRIFIEWSVRLLKTVYPLCVGTYLAICKNYFEISCPWNQMEKHIKACESIDILNSFTCNSIVRYINIHGRPGHTDPRKKYYFFWAPIREAHEYVLNLRRRLIWTIFKHAGDPPKLGLL